MFPGRKLREGFTMKVTEKYLTRPDLHEIAADLGIATNDILTENGILTIYNTSETTQEMIDNNALASFVAMSLDIPSENISELTPVVEEPVVFDFDPSDFMDEDDD